MTRKKHHFLSFATEHTHIAGDCKRFFYPPQGRRAGLASAGFSRCCTRGRFGKRADHHGRCFGLPKFSLFRTMIGEPAPHTWLVANLEIAWRWAIPAKFFNEVDINLDALDGELAS